MDNDYISKVIENISLTDVIEKLGIETKGKKALCPFHNDTHPSLAIYEETNQFHCFVCGVHGNVITIIKHVLNINLNDALEWLEKEYGYITDYKQKDDYVNTLDVSAIDIAYEAFSKMQKTELNGLNMFMKKRSFEFEQVKFPPLFYSKKDKLSKMFSNNSYKRELLIESNLIKSFYDEKSNSIVYHDFYKADRIIIPLHDYENKCKGFVARAINDDGKFENKPKYIFNKGLVKGKILYGLEHIVNQLPNINENVDIYVVEGAFDAIRLQEIGVYSIATLGNRMVGKQVDCLIEALDKYNKNYCKINIIFFLDFDSAGFRGTVQSLKNIWSRSSKYQIKVVLSNNDNKKDPDSLFESIVANDALSYLEYRTVGIFEFLFRYYLDKNEFSFLLDMSLNPEMAFRKVKQVNEKLEILRNISSSMSTKIWKDTIGFYNNVIYSSKPNYFLNILSSYLRINNEYDKAGIDMDFGLLNTLKIRNAIENTKLSYIDEDISLDAYTWDRIEVTFDIWGEYILKNGLSNNLQRFPLISYFSPKKIGEDREKRVYMHEQLIIQQVLLNELLTEDLNGIYEYIPAVRYYADSQTKRTTGVDPDVFKDNVVSFAYQIDMDSISSDKVNRRGMFRHYYECWKDYLKYLDEAIHKVKGEKLYFVRLDIKKFYDLLPRYAVNEALSPALDKIFAQPVRDKFEFLGVESSKEDLLDWITTEVFDYIYLDSESGVEYEKETKDFGIPQGPNISAYLANISLFKMDSKVVEQIEKWSEIDKEETAVYARYVDDMVIITNSSRKASILRVIISESLNDISLELSVDKDDVQEKSREEIEDELSVVSNSWGSYVMESIEEHIEDEINEAVFCDYCNREQAKSLIHSLELDYSSSNYKPDDIIETIFKTKDIRYSDIVRLIKLIIKQVFDKKDDGQDFSISEVRLIWNQNIYFAHHDSILHRNDIFASAVIDAMIRLKTGNISKHFNHIIQEKLYAVRDKIIDYVENSEELYELVMKHWLDSKNKYSSIGKIVKLYGKSSFNSKVYDKLCNMNDTEFIRRWRYSIARDIGDNGINKVLNGVKSPIELLHFFMSNLRMANNVEDYKLLRSLLKEMHQDEIDDEILRMLGCWLRNDIEVNDTEFLATSFSYLTSIMKPELLAQVLNNETQIFNDFLIDKNYNYLPVPSTVDISTVYGINMQTKFIGKAILNDEKNTDEGDWEIITSELVAHDRMKRPLGGFAKIQTEFQSMFCTNENEKSVINDENIKLIIAVYSKLVKYLKDMNTSESSLPISHHNVFVKIHKGICDGIEVYSDKALNENVSNRVWVSLQGDSSRIKPIFLPYINYEYWVSGQIIADALQLQNELIFERNLNYYYLTDLFSILSGERFLNIQTRSEKSYLKTITRNLDLSERFVNLDLKAKSTFMCDKDIVNKFISMSSQQLKFERKGEKVWALLNWAKHSIKLLNSDVVCIKDEYNEVLVDGNRREVGALLSIAKKLTQQKDYDGLISLGKSLSMYAVYLNMRLQIQEIFTAASPEELEALSSKIINQNDNELESTEEILQLLGVESDVALTTRLRDREHYASIKRALIGQKIPNTMNDLTAIGMLILLCEILELNDSNKVLKTSINSAQRDMIVGKISKFATILIAECNVENEEIDMEYPFDDYADELNVITEENISFMLNVLVDVDNATKITIRYVIANLLQIKRTSNKYDFIIDGKLTKNVPLTVLKQGHPFSTPFSYEVNSSENIIMTQSVLDDKLVGVSMISDLFSKLAFYRTDETIENNSEIQTKEDQIKEKYVEESLEKSTDQKEKKNNSDKICEIKDKENNLYNNDGLKSYSSDALTYLAQLQYQEWGKRINKNNIHSRIAYFQFDGGCSYVHPVYELSKEKQKEVIRINDGHEKILKSDDYYTSTEKRRCMMISKAIDICLLMGVEVLVLPEYSVRPETVLFIYNKLGDSKLSIWAGTFKVFPGSKKDIFRKANTSENLKLNNHEAVLPVISAKCDHAIDINSSEKGSYKRKLIIERSKKYPSIALEEVINPIRHTHKPIEPIMNNELGPKTLFFDARDDITECICSEYFLMSVPANQRTMFDTAFNLHKRFSNTKTDMNDYMSNCFKDVKTFGEFTALGSQIDKYSRRSILLLPAYTTRPYDHYVIAQASYLGSGLTTVFCNSVNGKSSGGSCFIGANSWDVKTKNVKIGDVNLLPDYTIYNGVEPGIYKQYSNDINRGALDKDEQALVICDINPIQSTQGKPNHETATKNLNLVAHIPFIEIYKKSTSEPYSIKTCKSINMDNLKLCKHCNKDSDESLFTSFEMALDKLGKYLKENSKDNQTDLEEVVIALKDIAVLIGSGWLRRRADSLASQHLNNASKGIPATIYDFTVVDMGCLSSHDDKYMIHVPKFSGE